MSCQEEQKMTSEEKPMTIEEKTMTIEERQKHNEKLTRETFSLLDKNADDVLSAEELVKGIVAIGFNPTNEDTAEIMKKHAKSDKMTKEEFEKFMMGKLKNKDNERILLEKAFKKFDHNLDGKVSVDELRRVLTGCGRCPMSNAEFEKAREEWFADDEDGDGYLDIIEFTKKFTRDFLSM